MNTSLSIIEESKCSSSIVDESISEIVLNRKNQPSFYSKFTPDELKKLVGDVVIQNNCETLNYFNKPEKKTMIIQISDNILSDIVIQPHISHILINNIKGFSKEISIFFPVGVEDGHNITVKSICNDQVCIKDSLNLIYHTISPGTVCNYVYFKPRGWINFS